MTRAVGLSTNLRLNPSLHRSPHAFKRMAERNFRD